MDLKEIEQIRSRVEQAVGQVVELFMKQSNKLKLPKREVGTISEQLTQTLVVDVVNSRKAEIDLAEKKLKGAKGADWEAYRKERNNEVTKTRKELKKYTFNTKDVESVTVSVGVPPTEEGNLGVS